MAHAAPPNPALTIFWDNKRQEGSCRYNIRIGYGHTSSLHPLPPPKPSTQAEQAAMKLQIFGYGYETLKKVWMNRKVFQTAI